MRSRIFCGGRQSLPRTSRIGAFRYQKISTYLLTCSRSVSEATARTNAALLAVAAQEAYATTSRRFDSIQQLISAIPNANDQKGILDLQARIEAEQGMLQNESTKLAVLYQAAQAEEWARQQSAREQVVAGVGNLRTLPALRLP